MRLRRLWTVVGVTVAMTVMTAGVVSGASTDQVVEGTQNGSVYKAGQTITVHGTVNGDVFCIGQTVNIDATINGDILCAGQTVNVNGTVNGSVRLAGQSVNLTAKVSKAASIAGQDVTLSGPATVGRDASFAGQTVTLNGKVSRDVSAATSSLLLYGTISRNVTATVEHLTLGNGTRIGGNLTYTSPNRLQKSGDAAVAGTTSYHEAFVRQNNPNHFFLYARLLWLLALIIFSVVVAALFGRLFRRLHTGWGREFWLALLAGFVAAIVIPIAIILLFVTIIGFPLGLLLLLLWLTAALLSIPVASYFVGNLLIARSHPVLIVLLGSLILAILVLIPFIGWLFLLAAYWYGIGVLLMSLRRHYPRVIPVRTENSVA